MIAQRPPPIGPPEEAPALQFGDHQIDEIGKRAGEIGRQNVEPVGRTLDKPFFERIGDAPGVPHKTQWPRAAAVRL